jgi:uroporphyrinogen-III decarboxylase
MNRKFVQDLAQAGLKMPLTVDLTLAAHAAHEVILLDGEQLGKVVEENAKWLGVPLAIPRMDLELEKLQLLDFLNIHVEEPGKFHFEKPPEQGMIDRVSALKDEPLLPRVEAQIKAVEYIAKNTDLISVGMAIGPFSLVTKIIADPISPVFIAGSGVTAEEDEEVLRMENALKLAIGIILHLVRRQLEAGAQAVLVCEPAANTSFFSPKQMSRGSDVFDRLVLAYNLQVKKLVEEYGACLFFHCCGELTETMLKKFCELDPALLSLGCSRTLWKDAAIVPDEIVLYGNLPSKRFYSDVLCSVDMVETMSAELLREMKLINRPFILGSECDILAVPGHEETIRHKATAILRA